MSCIAKLDKLTTLVGFVYVSTVPVNGSVNLNVYESAPGTAFALIILDDVSALLPQKAFVNCVVGTAVLNAYGPTQLPVLTPQSDCT